MAKVITEQRKRMTRMEMTVPFQLLLFTSTVGSSWSGEGKRRFLSN